jgi:hypothetical protein
MLASYHCAPMVVSIESAMMSRDCSENDMPDVPIEIPSLTPVAITHHTPHKGRWIRPQLYLYTY